MLEPRSKLVADRDTLSSQQHELRIARELSMAPLTAHARPQLFLGLKLRQCRGGTALNWAAADSGA